MINMSNQLSQNQEDIIIRADSLAALMSNIDKKWFKLQINPFWHSPASMVMIENN